MELLPQQLYWFARSGEYDKAESFNLFDCIECGACSWVCPSNIPLVQYYQHAKGAIREQQREQEEADRARLRFEQRQARLEKEKGGKGRTAPGADGGTQTESVGRRAREHGHQRARPGNSGEAPR